MPLPPRRNPGPVGTDDATFKELNSVEALFRQLGHAERSEKDAESARERGRGLINTGLGFAIGGTVLPLVFMASAPMAASFAFLSALIVFKGYYNKKIAEVEIPHAQATVQNLKEKIEAERKGVVGIAPQEKTTAEINLREKVTLQVKNSPK